MKKLINAGLIALVGLLSATVASQSAFAAGNDFDSRCADSTVVLCMGFDSDADVSTYVYGDELGTIRGTVDTATKSSGAGSLKFVIPSNTGANSSGGLERVFDETGAKGIPNGFMPGSTFYVQFKQKFSAEMLNAGMGGNGWKQAVLTSQFGTFGDPIEVGLYNRSLLNLPTLFQNGIAYTQTPSDNTNVSYTADQWFTFYIKVTVGDWGVGNSAITVWAAPEGSPLEQIYAVTNAIVAENPNDPGTGFNKIILSPDNYGKLSTTAHAPATTWYDELIVSSGPIADPYVEPVVVPPTPEPEPTPAPTPAPAPTPVATHRSSGGGGGGGGARPAATVPGKVLGATTLPTTPEAKAEMVVAIKAQIAALIQQLIILLNQELLAMQASSQTQ